MIKKIVVFLTVFACFIFNTIIVKDINNITSQKVINVDELLKIRPDIQFIQLSGSFERHRQKSPLSQEGVWWEQDNPIIIPQTFILSIPHGCAYGRRGSIVVEGMYVDELLWAPIKYDTPSLSLVDLSKLTDPQRIYGRIAVVTQGGSWNYYHWMVELLPRLLMLKESKIAYDYVYIPCDLPFMEELIPLLGIDEAKIIKISSSENCYIQADELIVPSLATAFGYTSHIAIDFLRDKCIPLAQNSINSDKFAKKIFISRRHAGRRKIKNEDEVFVLFEQYGFVRYDLEDLSVLEQVMLFYNAEIIVGEHGAGLTNIIFAQPGTQFLEIFQARQDPTYWYLSQELGLKYTCVKTIAFNAEKGGNFHSIVPLGPIKDVITQLCI